jgi:hypothetical protein
MSFSYFPEESFIDYFSGFTEFYTIKSITSLSHQFHTNTHKNVKTLLGIVTNYGISKKIQEKGNYFKSIVRTKEQDLYG